MTPKLKRVVISAGGGLVVFVGLAEWLLWLMPPPHRPFEHMIAGTAATVAALGMVFARVARWKDDRIGSRPVTRVEGDVRAFGSD